MYSQLLDLDIKLKNFGTILSFSGPFSQGIIEEVGDAIKFYVKNDTNAKSSLQKVFSVFIEQSQNIKNYSNRKKDTEVYDKINSSGIIIIGKKNDGYYVCSGNLIESKDAQGLSSKIDRLNKMSKEELKKEYKEQIKKDIHDMNSAGLGLIEMARKSKDGLEYSIEETEDNFSFFSLQISL